MLKNYLLLALRQLRKNRGYSFINIAGLATGMAIALIIGLWTADEWNHDRSYPDHDHIVQILANQTTNAFSKDKSERTYTGETMSSAARPFLRKGYEDIFSLYATLAGPWEGLMVNGEKTISKKGAWTDYSFPLIFGYHFLSGSAESLKDPSSAIISRSAAIALFGTENALGKTFKAGNQVPLTIGGVYADLPASSSWHDVDFFGSLENDAVKWLTTNTDFNDHSCRMYARLAPHATAEQAQARITSLPTPHVTRTHEFLTVYPFERFYLHYDINNFAIGGGRIGFVRLLGIIGVFVLGLAAINFMNLSTARSEQRAKEVGIRKTVGSLRSQLIMQFLGESVFVALLAFVLALLLTGLTLPWFSNLAGKTMVIPWADPYFWALSLGFTVATGLLAGSYPAFYLSSFRPVKVLKGIFKTGKGASLPRKVLVVAQFSISLSLIIGTIVVFRQIQYAKDRPLGYNHTGLITVPINTDTLDRHYNAVRAALLNTGYVANAAAASKTMTQFDQNNPMEWEGMRDDQKNISFADVWTNADFGPTIGWTIVKGRNFSRDFATDSTAAIVNEEGARRLEFKDPIGKQVKLWGKTYHIVGVVKDMLTNNPYSPIQASIFFGEGGHGAYTIRVKKDVPIHTALAAIESVFKKFNPASPFIYHFNDEEFQQKFLLETRIGNLTTVFSALAIFISCLGLFGLASFIAEQRTKEIGVRKVLGAKVVNLWALLSGDFIKLIAISMALAMPLIGLLMHNWLQNYELHTDLPASIFVASGAGMLLVTLTTVSYQALKAALMNPIKSLRTE